MEQALLGLFTTSFLVFALVVALLVSAIRNIVEKIFKKAEIVIPDKIEGILIDFWREWVLPALPIILGGLIAFFVTGYPFPEGFASSQSGRVFFGIVAGLLSSTVYRFTKFHVKKYVPDTIKEKLGKLSKSKDINNNDTVENPSEDIPAEEEKDPTNVL